MKLYPPDTQDHYAILGVSPDASPAEIKRAYYALLKRHLPDLASLNPLIQWETELLMTQVHLAYDILSDPAERARYDQRRHEPVLPPLPAAAKEANLRDLPRDLPAERPEWRPARRRRVNWALELFFAQKERSTQPQRMGLLTKALLLPIPFCLATATSSIFWHLGQVNHAALLGGISAVLAFPLIVVPLLLRLLLPHTYRPVLTLKQKLSWSPMILLGAMLAGWAWIAVVDHNGANTHPLDLCWWCGLISATCALLAYL